MCTTHGVFLSRPTHPSLDLYVNYLDTTLNFEYVDIVETTAYDLPTCTLNIGSATTLICAIRPLNEYTAPYMCQWWEGNRGVVPVVPVGEQ